MVRKFPFSKRAILVSSSFLVVAGGLHVQASEEVSAKPNVIVIMVDDMGYSDLGVYGGEIKTPNLDRLAKNGVKFSHFYNNSRCCPTRASLLTGLAPSQAGLGFMVYKTERDAKTKASTPQAYQGFLNKECRTVAELLKAGGYATLMTGKWHVGGHDKSVLPLQRGFEKFYGCLPGGTHYFYPGGSRNILLGDDPVEKLESTTDKKYYTTDAFTDYAIRFLKEEKKAKDRQFFLYLAYTAPHFPLHAHDDDIAKYKGKYVQGWNPHRQARFSRQLASGLLPKDTKLAPLASHIPDWEGLSEEKKEDMDLRMATYSAMIDNVDQNVGELLEYLKERGAYENTLIMFLSDNGACNEKHSKQLGMGDIKGSAKDPSQAEDVWVTYGAWANLSNVPFREFKRDTHEGGSNTPFFMYWPKGIKAKDHWYRSRGAVVDIVPTVLDVANVSYPSHLQDKLPLAGRSLRPAFSHIALEKKPIFTEHNHNAMMIDGDWKLVGKEVALPSGLNEKKWELYNLAKDPTELDDLSVREVERTKTMSKAWLEWANFAKVYPKPQK